MVIRALQTLLVLLLAGIAACAGWFGCGLMTLAVLHNADRNPYMFWIGAVLVATAALFAVAGGRLRAVLAPARSRGARGVRRAGPRLLRLRRRADRLVNGRQAALGPATTDRRPARAVPRRAKPAEPGRVR